MKELKDEHKAAIRSPVFDTEQKPRPSLLNYVNPVIIRLNEGKHTRDVAEEGPMSAPNSPSHE